MNCPICKREMEHRPDDEICQWSCECGKLYTEAFIRDMTPEKAEQLKEEKKSKAYFDEKREAEFIKGVAHEITERRMQDTKKMFDNFIEEDDENGEEPEQEAK